MSCGGNFQGATHLPANQFCCPQRQIFVEDLCGSLVGPTVATTAVWDAPSPNDYFQGTFSVTNTGVGAIVFGFNGVATITVPPLSEISISVNRPASFDIGALGPDQSVDYCIRLYKRV